MARIVWSKSKADTAEQCLFKYKKVYVDGIKEHSPALAFGNRMHTVAELALKQGLTDPYLIKQAAVKNDPFFTINAETRKAIDSIAAFVVAWKHFTIQQGEPSEFQVEQRYALNHALEPVEFFAEDGYIRGVFDMTAYFADKNLLVIADHKTNKQIAEMCDDLKNNKQLKLYAWILTKTFPYMHGASIHVCLNFLRHSTRAWVEFTQAEVDTFGIEFQAYLADLEASVNQCIETGVWPAKPNRYCNWCSFRSNCDSESAPAGNSNAIQIGDTVL